MKRRGRDLDQVHDDKKKIEEGKPMTFKFDDDLPGKKIILSFSFSFCYARVVWKYSMLLNFLKCLE